MNKVFAPGCALLLYKPALADKIYEMLAKNFEGLQLHTRCCHHEPGLPEGTTIINVCPGCDRRYKGLYKGINTISIWEIMDKMDIALPDYDGKEATVMDACPTRTKPSVHSSVRNLLERMNIKVSEPEQTRTKGKCCGDTYYGKISKAEVLQKMKERAGEMPAEAVVVYCVSCMKSMENGGKQPLYLPDLLFGEPTIAGECDPDIWHDQIDEFIKRH